MRGIAAAIVFFIMANVAYGQDAAKRLVGTWRLLDIKGGDGQMMPERGQNPTGLIYYDAAEVLTHIRTRLKVPARS